MLTTSALPVNATRLPSSPQLQRDLALSAATRGSLLTGGATAFPPGKVQTAASPTCVGLILMTTPSIKLRQYAPGTVSASLTLAIAILDGVVQIAMSPKGAPSTALLTDIVVVVFASATLGGRGRLAKRTMKC